MSAPRSFSRWLLPTIWVALLLVLAFLAADGLIEGDALGYLAFASLVESVLLCFFILLCVITTGAPHISLKVAWCVLGASSLLWLFRGGDAVNIPSYVGFILGFPIGLAVVYPVGHLSFVLPDWLLNSPVSFFVLFFAPMLLLGYWQWFWLLPRLAKWAQGLWARRKNQ